MAGLVVVKDRECNVVFELSGNNITLHGGLRYAGGAQTYRFRHWWRSKLREHGAIWRVIGA
jgi:hypothetical protein